MSTADPDSSMYYHGGNPDDPFVEDHQRRLAEDHWWPCPACGHSNPMETGCRCACHSQRRHG